MTITNLTDRRKKVLLCGALLPFAILTTVALYDYGYWGIITGLFNNTANMQVFFDLVLALSLILVWMWQDSRKNNRSFYRWLILTLLTGSFGPYCYLLFSKNEQK